MFKKKKFIIGGVLVIAAIIYLGYFVISNSATYYYTVSELTEKGDSITDENVRVNGEVLIGSVERELTGRILKFTIIDFDGEETVPVVYKGVVSDTFAEGGNVVAEGYLDSDGVFQAHTLLHKCPSKYIPEKSD